MFPRFTDEETNRIINIAAYIRESTLSTFNKSVSRQYESIRKYILTFGSNLNIDLTYVDDCEEYLPTYVKRGLKSLEMKMNWDNISSRQSMLNYTITNNISPSPSPTYKNGEGFNIQGYIDYILKVKKEHKSIDLIFVESFDRISREYHILREIRELSKYTHIPIISVNSKRLLTSYNDYELKIYSDFFKEEKSLLLLKLKHAEKKNNKNDICLIYFNDPAFLSLWKNNKLETLSLSKIQDILFSHGYITARGKPLAKNSISILKKYYINTIINS